APPPTPVLIRGDWLRPGETVEPGIPAVLDDPAQPFQLPPPGTQTTGRRRALAGWLTRPDNPLTARVIVNRLWAHHFGVGLVPTVENFGRSGAPPSHPELLDWLACRFAQGEMVSGGVVSGGVVSGEWSANSPLTIHHSPTPPWSLKALHRLIVTSAAYRQASISRASAAAVDPENR